MSVGKEARHRGCASADRLKLGSRRRSENRTYLAHAGSSCSVINGDMITKYRCTSRERRGCIWGMSFSSFDGACYKAIPTPDSTKTMELYPSMPGPSVGEGPTGTMSGRGAVYETASDLISAMVLSSRRHLRDINMRRRRGCGRCSMRQRVGFVAASLWGKVRGDKNGYRALLPVRMASHARHSQTFQLSSSARDLRAVRTGKRSDFGVIQAPRNARFIKTRRLERMASDARRSSIRLHLGSTRETKQGRRSESESLSCMYFVRRARVREDRQRDLIAEKPETERKKQDCVHCVEALACDPQFKRAILFREGLLNGRSRAVIGESRYSSYRPGIF
uniref:Uncharacterized protein n=1 Tax=Mycena chlorophos TaxID=658473 RepID=A0ABQ0L972_MYCCL|nr:predicted protein [Mycena chlorophos]